MPRVTVENESSFDVEAGKKLVLALEDNGIDVLHRCGGNARCTTCRVEIVSGEVPPMSEEEREALEEPELIAKYRLSCQLRVESDLTVRVAKRSHIEQLDPGPRPED
jgi:ferredoxin